MRKAFLCAVLVLACVSSAFGGATGDPFKSIDSWLATPKRVKIFATPEGVEKFMRAGNDVNSKSTDGITPLMLAVSIQSDNLAAVNALIKAGADVNSMCNDGTTVLMVAARNNSNLEILNVLIKAGADVKAKNNDGRTVLIHAAWKNSNPEVVNALIKAGADINAKNNGGITALMAAAESNSNPEVVNTLINAGADVNAKAKDGRTALIRAAQGLYFERSNFLIKSGVDVNVATKIALKQANNNPEVVKALINAGADISAKDANGKTALDYAKDIKNSNSEQIKRIILDAAK